MNFLHLSNKFYDLDGLLNILTVLFFKLRLYSLEILVGVIKLIIKLLFLLHVFINKIFNLLLEIILSFLDFKVNLLLPLVLELLLLLLFTLPLQGILVYKDIFKVLSYAVIVWSLFELYFF